MFQCSMESLCAITPHWRRSKPHASIRKHDCQVPALCPIGSFEIGLFNVPWFLELITTIGNTLQCHAKIWHPLEEVLASGIEYDAVVIDLSLWVATQTFTWSYLATYEIRMNLLIYICTRKKIKYCTTVLILSSMRYEIWLHLRY